MLQIVAHRDTLLLRYGASHVLIFTGTYDHSIDKKNRLAIPAEVRSQIMRSTGKGKDDAIVLYVTPGQDGTLCLYTEQGCEQRANELDNSEMDPVELVAYETVLYAMSQPVEIDKQGRITLPGELYKRSGLGVEIVLIGAKDHLEIRDRQTWYAYLEQILQDRPDIVMNPRLAMRRRRSNNQDTNARDTPDA